MASSQQTQIDATSAPKRLALAKALAPEEIRVGDFVTPLYMIAELPSFYWLSEGWNLPADKPVRIRFTCGSNGSPLKVKSVCLPFVLVKQATGGEMSLDLRKCQLARLDGEHARRAWKAMKKQKSQKQGSLA